jgi:PKD repeat protein
VSASPQFPAPGATVTVDATGSTDPDGRIRTYELDVNADGRVERRNTDGVFTYRFPEGGVYALRVRVTDDDGATDTVTEGFRVRTAVPTPACSVSSTAIRPGDRLTLDASASRNVTLVRFDPDGDGSFQRTDDGDFRIRASYDEPGRYVPRVQGINGRRRASVECPAVVVGDNRAPTVALSTTPGVPGANETVRLRANATDGDGSVVAYRWDLDGDGEIDRRTTAGETTTSYAVGEYRPTVTAVDDDGATDTAGRRLRVGGDPPVARCSVSPTATAVGATVVLDATDSENATTVAYDVDGDGEFDRQGEDRQTTVTYDAAGSYRPAVRATDDDGRTDRADCGLVTVTAGGDPPTADLEVAPASPEVGEPARFDAGRSSDDGSVVEYRWDFQDDGQFDRITRGPETRYTYETAGEYAARVQVADAGGATAEATVTFDVDPAEPDPVARCSVTPTTATVGESVTVNASASTAAAGVEVDREGDGTVDVRSDDLVVTVAYDGPGTYRPRVRVDGDGSDAVDCPAVTVRAETTDGDDGGAGDGDDDGGDDEGSSGLGVVPLAVGGLVVLALAVGAVFVVRGGTGGSDDGGDDRDSPYDGPPDLDDDE